MNEELKYEELPLYKNLLVELVEEADFWNLDIDFDKLSPETDLKDLGFDESDISMIIYRADDDLGDIITLDELAEIKTLKNICDLAKTKEQIRFFRYNFDYFWTEIDFGINIPEEIWKNCKTLEDIYLGFIKGGYAKNETNWTRSSWFYYR